MAELAAAIFCVLSANAGDSEFNNWPLQNGDFRMMGSRGMPADWEAAINSGAHTFRKAPAPPPVPEFPYHATYINNHPTAAVIETQADGRAYFYQRVSLLEGKYVLTAEVSGSDGARATLNFAAGSSTIDSKTIPVNSTWTSLRVDVGHAKGEANIGLLADARAGQETRFRNVMLDAGELDTAPVPFADGSQLGGLKLSLDPGPAERYAAYELQRYLFKMTGKTPGIEGRDRTHPGRRISIRSVAKSDHEPTFDDTYAIEYSDEDIVLGGQSPMGTLYAAYDFLRTQGCRWIVPGELGEVVPRADALKLPAAKREIPDYQVRGHMILAMEFTEKAGWQTMDLDATFDWAVRNRFNVLWFGGISTIDFGAHRGRGWVQLTNHSYNNIVAPHQKHFAEHPEWYAQFNGKRMAVCDLSPQFNNQLCLSNQELRDYTVDLALTYFRNTPQARAFPLNPMDGPVYWCECGGCKALDPAGVDWSNHHKGDVKGMTDRALNYANEVAERVTEVYPEKLIEMLSYSYTLSPPVRNRVHPNVILKYANLSGGRGRGPLGISMGDAEAPLWKDWHEQLAGWNDVGAHRFSLYDYFDYVQADAPLFWYYSVAEMMKTLHRNFHFRSVFGETETNVMNSPLTYQVLAHCLWDVDTDYREVLRDVCEHYYGPAGADLATYHLVMDQAIRQSTAWREKGRKPLDHVDIPLDTLEAEHANLAAAAAKVQDDPMPSRRVGYARFGHAWLTYLRALNEKNKTTHTRAIARKAFDEAKDLGHEHDIVIKHSTPDQLKTFYYPPVVETDSAVMEFPAEWRFKRDPDDIGIRDKWFQAPGDNTWVPISILEAWTSQKPGLEYHGTAWYRTDFSLGANESEGEGFAIYFGAVDGLVDVFLDGDKIGEQKESVGYMWDRPFQIALPADFDRNGTHELAVRVEKDNFAAGIWKPVKIIKNREENAMRSNIKLKPYVWEGPYAEMRQKYACAHDPGLCADLRAPWMKNGDRLILRSSEIIGFPEGFFYDDHFPTQQLDTRGKEYQHIPFGWDLEKAPHELSASCTVKGKGWFSLTLTSRDDYVDIELAVRNDSSAKMDYVDWYFCVVGHESPSIGDPTLERTFFYDGESLRSLAEVSGAGKGEEMYLVHGPRGADGFIPELHSRHPKQPVHPMLPLVMVQTADGKHTAALGFERAHSIFSSLGNRCFHADPFFGFGLDPGEEWKIKGRLYLMEGSPQNALARFRKDFAID